MRSEYLGSEVQLQDLTKSYGNMNAVKDVSLTIGAGEFFTILGPSGSGKTTTMMMIAGFEYPTSGTIRIGQENVANLPPQKRGLGMVFQNYAVFPHLSVYQNVAFPLRVRRYSKTKTKAAVDEALSLVQLSDLSARMPRALSGGQQQRVALARALVFQPRVLLMDEPLGALDKKLRDHMQTEIRRIHQTLRVTVIYVTHDQSEALTMSDRIAIMNQGTIEQIGSPADLYDRPRTKFVADFLGDTNFVKGTLAEIRGEIATIKTINGSMFSGILADVSLKEGAAVLAGVRPEKIRISLSELGSENSRIARVADVVFSGDVTRYHTCGAPGERLLITSPNREGIPKFVAGDKVALNWSPSEMRIFPAERNDV
jgi:putative spermidine/putrescine transport system ATP-binding protein